MSPRYYHVSQILGIGGAIPDFAARKLFFVGQDNVERGDRNWAGKWLGVRLGIRISFVQKRVVGVVKATVLMVCGGCRISLPIEIVLGLK